MSVPGTIEATPQRLLLFIRSLNRGGAERQLYELARGLRSEFKVRVVTLYQGGSYWESLERQAIRLTSLQKSSRWDLAGPTLRLVHLLRKWRPHLIQSFLPEANVAAALTRTFAPESRLVWGIRASNMDLSRYDRFSRLLFTCAARLAVRADRIIVNSERGRTYHVDHGYPPERMVVIPNGIDTAVFRPDPAKRTAFRSRLGLTADIPLVGVAGRLDPMKGYETFLSAARRLLIEMPGVRFVCAGAGVVDYERRLKGFAHDLGLDTSLHWLGELDEMTGFYNGVDVLVLPSAFGEGFPNVVGEAMATGTPCVVTDVGDSALVVGDAGWVAPPGDSQRLADAVAHALRDLPSSRGLGLRARARIAKHFEVSEMVSRTAAVYRQLLGW